MATVSMIEYDDASPEVREIYDDIMATQKADLRQRLNVDKSAVQLKNFFEASVELMQVIARACGHNALNQFTANDLSTWNREMARLSGIKYAGLMEP